MPQQAPQVPEQSDRMAAGSLGQPGRVRQDILSSWKRSLVAGLTPERFAVPHLTDVDEDGPLAWAAAPVMAALAEELEGTGIGILLADSRGQIISRRSGDRHVLRLLDKIELAPGALYDEDHIGTNAIGTAVFQARPSMVAGPEHFADALGKMACAASPVTDADGQLIGVLDLTCAARDFNPLMLPLVKHAVAEITAELAAGRRLAMPQGSLALRTAPEDAIPPRAEMGGSHRHAENGRRARHRRAHQPGCRRAALPVSAHRRLSSPPDLPQARCQVTGRTGPARWSRACESAARPGSAANRGAARRDPAGLKCCLRNDQSCRNWPRHKGTCPGAWRLQGDRPRNEASPFGISG
jgi:transcriptional regulator of acetoin/glycerol metabolism